jgi:hypothetical protein
MIEGIPEERLLLAEVDILRGLSLDETECLVRRSEVACLGKGEGLTLGGDHCGILLVSGRVRVHEPNLGSQDLTFSIVEGATVVGHIDSAPGLSRALRVEAFEPSVLRIVKWGDLVRKEVPARLADLIRRLSERVGAAPEGDYRIPARYTHKQLASMVRSNREAVTRALGRLSKAGAVETRDRRIYVTDAVVLEDFAGAVR